MIKNISILALIVLFIGCSSQPKIPEFVELNTWQDSVSYSLGNDIGKNFKNRGMEYKNDTFNLGFIETYSKDTSYAYGASLASNLMLQGIKINPNILLRAFENTTIGDSLLLTGVEINTVIQKYNTQLRDEATERARLEAEDVLKEGEEFLDKYKNEHNDEIVTESGLVYRVINEGFGNIPTENDRVTVHYTGTLIDGTIFDSSIERGEPAKFMVGGVIQGWQEAMQLMNVGSKWELVIPSNLAYGERSTGNIPANSTLLFEVELLDIE